MSAETLESVYFTHIEADLKCCHCSETVSLRLTEADGLSWPMSAEDLRESLEITAEDSHGWQHGLCPPMRPCERSLRPRR